MAPNWRAETGEDAGEPQAKGALNLLQGDG
jgi:hypothetical protein